MFSKIHSSSTTILAKLRLFLLYSFPVVLFCSYYPLIPITTSSSTNYELSLPLIWLLLFSVLSLGDFIRVIYNIYQKRPLYLLPLLFPLYLSATILWSANPLRGIMTAGILWCLIITSVTIFMVFKPAKYFDKTIFLKIFLLSTTAFCILCWIQAILDCFGIDRSLTLLCSGCTSYSFGFPHPSGLAIEPQFMGNLLLAPVLTSLYLWTRTDSHTSKLPFNRKILAALAFFFSSTLFLTFSRGAIYSFTIAFVILLIFSVARLKNTKFWKTIPLLIASFLFTLFAQGVFAATSYTNSTFASGIERSISQLSLGQINLELSPIIDLPGTESDTSAEATPVFDGYVEESTDVRMSLNQTALELAPRTPTTLLFGYGLGSAGEVMYQAAKTATPLEIVQNEYLSLLLETGVLGLLLTIFACVIIVLSHKSAPRSEGRYLLISVIISFLFSLLFFSGFPNAIHLYLFPVFLLASLPHSRLDHSSPA